MLKGIDISRYQKNLDKEYITQQDFVMIKATEGTTYKDFMMDGYTGLVDEYGILKGYYHRARPDKNLAIPEAKKFITKVRNYLGDSMLALEWSLDSNEHTALWALDWLSYIKEETGITPIFQASGKYIDKYEIICEAGFPLWIVEWTARNPNIGKWNDWTMWQNTVDMNMLANQDYFNGTVEDFKRLCGKE